jgi:hypothetical protein
VAGALERPTGGDIEFIQKTGLERKMPTLMGINKVNWGQVGRVTKPDRYQYSFGWLTIAADDIAIWEKNPNAVFTLVNAAATKDHPEDEYRLGTFELRQTPYDPNGHA